MNAHHDAALVVSALDAAAATRGRPRMSDTIFHTDRGAEDDSAACIAACQRLGLRRSMGRTGSCLDNAVAESWFASLKVELVTEPTTAPGLRPAPPSSPGSPGTTASDCTPPVTNCHPSNGNSATPPSARYHRPRPHSLGVHLPGGGPRAHRALQISIRFRKRAGQSSGAKPPRPPRRVRAARPAGSPRDHGERSSRIPGPLRP
jgi:transposase InsO family protein